jgi:hypothetical protein
MTTTTRFIPCSLAQAICAEGIPSLHIGHTAAQQGLVILTTGEGLPHFEWSEKALNKRGVAFLEQLLMGLRETRKEQTNAR